MSIYAMEFNLPPDINPQLHDWVGNAISAEMGILPHGWRGPTLSQLEPKIPTDLAEKPSGQNLNGLIGLEQGLGVAKINKASAYMVRGQSWPAEILPRFTVGDNVRGATHLLLQELVMMQLPVAQMDSITVDRLPFPDITKDAAYTTCRRVQEQIMGEDFSRRTETGNFERTTRDNIITAIMRGQVDYGPPA